MCGRGGGVGEPGVVPNGITGRFLKTGIYCRALTNNKYCMCSRLGALVSAVTRQRQRPVRSHVTCVVSLVPAWLCLTSDLSLRTNGTNNVNDIPIVDIQTGSSTTQPRDSGRN